MYSCETYTGHCVALMYMGSGNFDFVGENPYPKIYAHRVKLHFDVRFVLDRIEV